MSDDRPDASNAPHHPQSADTGYDAVRDRLLARGYLDGQIERFLLAGAGRPGSTALAMLRTTVKAALVGALPLGAIVMLAALATHAPPARPADLLVLWGYFSVLACAALLVLLSVVAAPATWLARRRARGWHPFFAGLAAGAAVLVYVMLLWTGSRASSSLWWWSVLSLASSLAATLLVAWLARLVTVAGIAGHTGQVPRRRRRAVLFAILALAPIGIALLIARPGAPMRQPAPFEPFDDPGRVIVVAIDGADADLLPASESAAVWRLDGAARRSPPELWTTIATGVPAGRHGVHGVGAGRLPGVRAPLSFDDGRVPLSAAIRLLFPATTVPVSGAFREERTAWEIAALRRPVVSVNWWSSWPASLEGEGYVVSDRAFARLLAGASPDRDTWPESLVERLREEFAGDGLELDEEMAARFGSDSESPLWQLVHDSFAIDAWNWRQMRRLWSDPAVRAAFVHLPGLDILRVRLEGRPEADSLASARVLTEYAAWVAGLALDGPAAIGAEASLIVATPGRAAAPDAAGFVRIVGRQVRPGCSGDPLRPLDVGPLILAALGFPASREMPGRPDLRCFRSGTDARIATYGRRSLSEDARPDAWDPDLVERLRSLGYLN